MENYQKLPEDLIAVTVLYAQLLNERSFANLYHYGAALLACTAKYESSPDPLVRKELGQQWINRYAYHQLMPGASVFLQSHMDTCAEQIVNSGAVRELAAQANNAQLMACLCLDRLGRVIPGVTNASKNFQNLLSAWSGTDVDMKKLNSTKGMIDFLYGPGFLGLYGDDLVFDDLLPRKLLEMNIPVAGIPSKQVTTITMPDALTEQPR